MTQGVAKRSAESQAMLDAAARGRALMGGSTAMRAAEQTYLPKFEAESPDNYAARLGLSWLFNGYRKTVRDMKGRVFDTPTELAEGSPETTIEWAKNIDLQGNDLSVFAAKVFEDALAGAGISYIMVDAPTRSGGETRAQAQRENLRPYLASLRVEDILGWKTAVVDNATTLSMIRIHETVTGPTDDEFEDEQIDQIRVLDRVEGGVRTRLYRVGNTRTGAWEPFGDETLVDIPEITVTPFYANRSGFFQGEPMLDDLADVNIAHWQSQSDQRNILHAARVPILFGAGMADNDDIVISSGRAVKATDPQAKLAWVEHSGEAIGAGRQDLKDLEFQMETHGLQLLVARSETATGATLDAKKETSPLAMTADQLKDTLERAMKWATMYGGKETDVGVDVNKDFGVTGMTAQELTALLSAVNTGNMSRRTFLGEMKRRGMVRADLDVEDEIDMIEDDEDSLMAPPDDGGE